jgi:hypothetical protein
VTTLAKGIVQIAESLGPVRSSLFPFYPYHLHDDLGACLLSCREIWQIKAAIQPLYNLLTRFTPDLSYLTPIHSIFVTVGVLRFLLAHQRIPDVRI